MTVVKLANQAPLVLFYLLKNSADTIYHIVKGQGPEMHWLHVIFE